MVREDQLQHRLPGVDYARRVGTDDHALRADGLAGGREVLASLDLDHTDAADAGVVRIVELMQVHVAQRRDFDSGSGGGFDQVGAFGHLDLQVVDGQFYRFHACFFFGYLMQIAPNLHFSRQVPHLMQWAWSMA